MSFIVPEANEKMPQENDLCINENIYCKDINSIFDNNHKPLCCSKWTSYEETEDMNTDNNNNGIYIYILVK